ncbi:unnamed protein product [Soboliphyme baturini]|uniref:Secreted protein n=1 Tax=Soboliphyme baturini TaxID=241478 RepID=A0A183IR23_9BILA|nr:unnamed protein product [Soboliphyme baturini]
MNKSLALLVLLTMVVYGCGLTTVASAVTELCNELLRNPSTGENDLLTNACQASTLADILDSISTNLHEVVATYLIRKGIRQWHLVLYLRLP